MPAASCVRHRRPSDAIVAGLWISPAARLLARLGQCFGVSAGVGRSPLVLADLGQLVAGDFIVVVRRVQCQDVPSLGRSIYGMFMVGLVCFAAELRRCRPPGHAISRSVKPSLARSGRTCTLLVPRWVGRCRLVASCFLFTMLPLFTSLQHSSLRQQVKQGKGGQDDFFTRSIHCRQRSVVLQLLA